MAFWASFLIALSKSQWPCSGLLFIAYPLLGCLVAEVQCSRVPINSYASVAYYSGVIITLYDTPSAEPEGGQGRRKAGQTFTYDGTIHQLVHGKILQHSLLLVPRTPGTRVPISLHDTQSEGVVVAQTVITTEKHNSKREIIIYCFRSTMQNVLLGYLVTGQKVIW